MIVVQIALAAITIGILIFAIVDVSKTRNHYRQYGNLKEKIESITKDIETESKIQSELIQKISQLNLDKEVIQQETNEIIQQKNNALLNAQEEKYKIEKELEKQTKEFNNALNKYEDILNAAKVECETTVGAYNKKINTAQQNFETLIAPLRLYEKEQQDKLYYTIQIPEEYRDDIAYLLNEVTKKVEHPTIVSKLVWNEYVKPYLDETLKRIEMGEKCGIYKITSLLDGKCYIGKSTNLKTRVQNHFKSVVGIDSVADQYVHHVILENGIWNFTIEKVCECSKEELNEKEKYYIDFFKAQEYGYNKKAGG